MAVLLCCPTGVSGAGEPGRCVCRRVRPLCVPVGGGPPASRPRREPLARRVVSKPGQAPPPPTGTAADPSGALHTGGAVSLECGWVRRLEARPGPAPRSVPYPQFRMQFPDTCSSSLSEKPGISTITFQSMKCTRGNCMRICADQALPPTGTAARPSGPSGALHTSVALRVVLRSGQASPPGPVDQVGRLSETVIAFACWYLCGSETCIAFAGAKWAYLVHFSGAVVMSVSAVPCWGRAVVLLVSTSPCCRALGAMFFSLLGLVCASAKKFALRGANNVETQKSSPSAGKMTTNWRFMARWASFFAEMPLEGRCWASFFAEMPLEGRCWANFVADRQSWDPTGQVVLRRWCSGRRMARPLCVPVGGGPPASRPRRELRSARRLEARPGPAAAHGYRSQALRRPPHRWRSVCRCVQWAGPGLVVDCYALSAADSSPVTSPCTLGW